MKKVDDLTIHTWKVPSNITALAIENQIEKILPWNQLLHTDRSLVFKIYYKLCKEFGYDK